MCKKSEKQMPLTPPKIDHPIAMELEAISRILDQNDTILDFVNQDLSRPFQGPETGERRSQWHDRRTGSSSRPDQADV